MSTKKYLDGEKGWIDSLLTATPIIEVKKVAVEPIVDIDPDIEREIAQLQEASFVEKIKEIKLVEKKQEQKVELADELGSFFGAITKAKTDLTEKIEKEEVKIEGLEELFNELASSKKKKKEIKKVLLVGPEKEIVPEVNTEELVDELIQLAVVEETIEETIEEKIEDKMIAKVKKQISGMRNANELDKERVKQLASLDTWEKLKEEFLSFKHTVNVQLGTVGGGGLDPHNIDSDFLPGNTNTYNLGSASRRWKDIFLSSNSINLDGATISSDGTGAIAIAATGATLPKGSKTEDGNELAVMGATSTGTLSQPIRNVDFFSAAGGLDTANATFEFNASVDQRYTFIDSSTFTLSDGEVLVDTGITLFQL
jgi:hypothetical protein